MKAKGDTRHLPEVGHVGGQHRVTERECCSTDEQSEKALTNLGSVAVHAACQPAARSLSCRDRRSSLPATRRGRAGEGAEGPNCSLDRGRGRGRQAHRGECRFRVAGRGRNALDQPFDGSCAPSCIDESRISGTRADAAVRVALDGGFDILVMLLGPL